MRYEISIVKNTLPYIQPYSVMAIKKPFEMGDRAVILGNYRNKEEAEEAQKQFMSHYNLSGKIPVDIPGSIFKDPIKCLEERIKTRQEKIETKPENKKRKIILD